MDMFLRILIVVLTAELCLSQVSEALDMGKCSFSLQCGGKEEKKKYEPDADSCPCFLQNATEVDESRKLLRSLKRVADCPQTGFVLPRSSQTTDYIRVKTAMPNLSTFSMCFWIDPTFSSFPMGSFLSYAAGSRDNELLLHFLGKTELRIGIVNELKSTAVSISGKTHMCLVVERQSSWAKLYTGGEHHSTLRYAGTLSVQGGGCLLFGQEQDSLAGSFDSSQSFSGSFYNFMMWDRVLDEAEISQMSQTGCACADDHILAMTPDVVQLEGGASFVGVSQCV